MHPFKPGLLTLALCACAGPAAPPTDSPPAAQPASDSVRSTRVIALCVLRSGELATVDATANDGTGDTLVAGRPLREAHPPLSAPYLAGADWFARGEPIFFGGRRFTQYGLPRTLGIGEVARVGEFRGLPLFADTAGLRRPEVFYILIRPGPDCVFQTYQNT